MKWWEGATGPSYGHMACCYVLQSATAKAQDRPFFSDEDTEAQKGGVISQKSHSTGLRQGLHPGFLALPHVLWLPHPVARESWGLGSLMSSFPPRT